jgi:branched-chain amino acid transport system substrate-binding protein
VASGAFADDGPIRIGVYLPLTGQVAFGGQLELEGVQLAHQEFPEALGRPIEIFIVDNRSDRVEAANAVTRLIEHYNVHAIIGTYGSAFAMAGGEVAERHGIPVMGTSCTNPLVTLDKEFYFRACFIDSFQGAAAAYFVFNDLGFKKAATLVDMAADYSIGLGNFFRQGFERLGGEIVSDMRYNSGDLDFTAQLTEIMAHGPDIVFIPSYFAEGAIIMKQARELGATFAFLGGDAMDNPNVVELGGDAVEGFMFTAFAYDPNMPNLNPVAQRFTELWRAAHPDREPNANAALGYDSYILVLDAIKRAGSSVPKAIRDAMAETKNVPTVTGMTTLNEHGDAEKELAIIKIVDGRRQFHSLVQP